MPVTIVHCAQVVAYESTVADAVGGEVVKVPHRIEYHAASEGFHDVWSQAVAVEPGPPVVLDLAGLVMPRRVEAKDLFTDQAVGLLRLRNVGEHTPLVACKTAGGDALLQFGLGPSADFHWCVAAGHVLAQPLKTVEFMALTGAATIEVLIATRPSP